MINGNILFLFGSFFTAKYFQSSFYLCKYTPSIEFGLFLHAIYSVFPDFCNLLALGSCALALWKPMNNSPLTDQLIKYPGEVAFGVFCINLIGKFYSYKFTLPHTATSTFSLLFLLSCLRGFLKMLIFPAPVINSLNVESIERERANLLSSISNIQLAMVPVYDKKKLVGRIEVVTFVYPKGNQLESGKIIPSEKWVIYSGGNAEVWELSYQSQKNFVEKVLGDNVNLVIFNHRGVGKSQGAINCANDLILDAEAVGNYVKGVIQTKSWDPFKTSTSSAKCKTINNFATSPDKVFSSSSVIDRNILLIGHSIGGMAVAHLAKNVFKDSPVIFDRTFSNLIDVSKNLSPIKNDLIVEKLMPFIFGNYDILESFNSINHPLKFVLFHEEDFIINYEKTSLARTSNKIPENHRYQLLGNCDYHNACLINFDNGEVIIREILKKINWKS